MKLSECTSVLWQDALSLLCGKFIGYGISRDTYVCGFDDKLVVKVQTDTQRFQNQHEWEIWGRLQDHKLGKWLAPCTAISDSGNWMLQKRTQPVTLEELKKRLPRVPMMFTDCKHENWGRLGKRIVCHDYGTCLVTEYGSTTRTKKADWY